MEGFASASFYTALVYCITIKYDCYVAIFFSNTQPGGGSTQAGDLAVCAIRRTFSSYLSAIAIALLALVAPVANASSLQELIAKNEAWRGGRAFQSLKSLHVRGQMEAGGLTGLAESRSTATGEVWQMAHLGPVEQAMGVGVERGWATTPSGQIEAMSAESMTDNRRESLLDFSGFLRARAEARVRLLPDEMRDGASWHVVHLDFGGEDAYEFFLDDTGSQHGYRKLQGGHASFVRQGNWRIVDGVRVPFLVETLGATPEENTRFQVTEVGVNEATPKGWLDTPVIASHARIADSTARSSWIPFEMNDSGMIFIPASIRGIQTKVMLDSGAETTVIDNQFATRVGLRSEGSVPTVGTGGTATASIASGTAIQIGEVSLEGLNVAVLPLKELSIAAGQPITIVLGKELLNELLVDIDFENRRIAFARPDSVQLPPGASSVTLVRDSSGLRAVEVAIEGGAPVLATFDLGNSAAPAALNPSYWKPSHILEGHAQTLAYSSGVGGSNIHSRICLRTLAIGGFVFSSVPTDLEPDGHSAFESNRLAANLGVLVWQRFRLLIDFPHDRLYLVPTTGSVDRPFDKDRTGLALERTVTGMLVRGVAAGSPAQAGGWKAGDRITSVNGRPEPETIAAKAWQYGLAGTTISLAGLDSQGLPFERRLTLQDFY